MGIILEPRLLFDASVGGTTTKESTADSASSTTSTTDSTHTTTDKSTTAVAAPVDQSTAVQAKAAAATTPVADAQKTAPTSADPSASKDTSGVSQSGASGASGATAASTAIDSVLFVDPRVSGWQDLAGSVSASTKVVVIDPTLDGISQVTQTLSQLHGIKEVDFLTYGQSGQIELGSSVVSDASLMASATAVAGWRNSLTDSAQIQFWGCDVGAGDAGAAFVNDLHTLTGVGIAASTDATGAAALNGDWILERTAGLVTAFHPFSSDAESHFDTVLDAPTATVGLTLPGSVLLGNTYTATLTFENDATNGVGYGPFVELFVQTNNTVGTGTEASTLTSASFLGSSVSYQTITLSSTVTGHVGTVGALNPSLLDSSGHATFVAAPTGFQAGDTMYVLTLPFGSFTPGQPQASISLNFTNDSRSDLTAAGALKMTAIGGYQYGADALNNPGTDPSIIDATHSASASTNVNLINVTTVANTNPGEGETATGPTFPSTYTITLTPASAVSSDPINNFVYTFNVPDDISYTGGTIGVTGGGTAVFTAADATHHAKITVTYPALSGASTISIPYFVPQFANGPSSPTEIISPADANPASVNLSPTYTYSATNWTPVTGAFHTTAQPVTGSGNGTDPVFSAKSFAVQVTDAVDTDVGATGFSPGDTLKYTINFEVSDYFNIDNLVLNDVLGDGMTLLPGTSPVLSLTRNGVTGSDVSFGALSTATTTVNGQSVATSDSNANWSFAARDGSGQTGLQFNVGTLLGGASEIDGGTSGSGTHGTVTFYAQALDKYTNINGLNSLREKDSTSNSVTGHADVTSKDVGSTAHAQSDGSSVSNTIAAGNLTLVISKINGVAVADPNNVQIQPGDLVTYEMDYNLTTGDYGALKLNGFLPLPVYGVPGALTSGNGTDVNTYSVLSRPTGDTNTPAVSTNATANSVSFNFGTYDSTTASAGASANTGAQKVAVQFTLQASNDPFADGLALTAQAQASYTNAGGATTATATIKQQTMIEPELVTKTGIVSDRNDANNANQTTAIYVADTGASSADPTTIFTPTGSGAIFSGAIPTAIGNAENQNLTGADGGDHVRVVQTVQNTGAGKAYDVFVKGTLPTGYSVADITNLTVVRGDGTTLTLNAADNTAAIAAYFSGTGLQISAGSTSNAVLNGSATAATAIMYVAYDIGLKALAAPSSVLTVNGAVANWSGAHGATGFVTNGNAVGVSAANLNDNATITVSAANVVKTLTAGNDSTSVPLNSVVVGETLTYTIVLTLPEGQLTAAQFNDALPSFLDGTTASLVSVTHSTGVTFTGAGTLGVSGQQLTVALGDVSNANADATGTVTFTFTVKVANSTNVDGSTINNSATVTSSNAPTYTSNTVTATEKDPHITETLTVNDGGSAVHSGQTLTYTVTFTNTGNAPAEDLIDQLPLTLPTGLTWVGNITNTVTGGATGVAVDNTARTIKVDHLAAGTSTTFTFQATVNNNLAANTPLAVTDATTITSMPGSVTGERTGTSNPTTYAVTKTSTVTTGVFAPTLVIVDQSNGTSTADGITVPSQAAPTAATDAVVGEIVRMKAYVEIPEGQNTLNLAVTLPPGLDFLNDGNTTVALASPNGQVLSSTIDPTGTNGAIQVNDTTGFNVATYNPTAAMTSGISVAGNVVSFNFGTVQNNANSTVKNYAIVEFNAVVKNVVGNQSGTALSSSVQANGTGTTSSDTVNVKEPAVTIAKSITGINQATGAITWQVVVTNTGAAGSAPTAYDVNLTDAQSVGAQTNQGTITGLATTGTASGLSVVSGNGTRSLQATMNLAAGASETFTYTTTLTDKTARLQDSTASVTWTSINSAVAATFNGSSDNATGGGAATAGTTDGERTGADGVGGTLNDYDQTATVGINAISGNIWNDVGSPLNTADQSKDSTADTELSGVTVTGTWTGGSGTVTTSGTGDYSILTPDNVSTVISVPTTIGTGGTQETLVYETDGTSGTAAPNHVEAGLSTAQAKTTIAAGAAGGYTGVNFAYRLPDTGATIGTWSTVTAGTEPTYTVGGTPVTLHSGTSTGVTDTEINALITSGTTSGYVGNVLTIARDSSQGGPLAGDTFGGGGLLSFTGTTSGNVVYNGTTIGTYTMSGGTMAVTFGSGTTSTDVTNVLNNVTFSTTANQLASGVQINASLTDNNTQSGSTAGDNFQGTGGVHTSNIVTALLDIAPTPVVAAFTEPNDTAASGAAVALAPAITVASGTQTYNSVVLQLTTNFQTAQDVLAFTNTAKITGVYNATTGTLTLTNTGTATTADWQAALRAVTYYDSSDTPNTATRTVTIAATSAGTDVVNGTLATVTVVSVDDSPILNTAVAVSLPHGTEDAVGAPVGASAGFLVSSLAGTSLNVTDPDGSSTGAATTGIAITHADTSEGNWWYSTNNGTTWTQMTAITGSNVLQLVGNANTRLYFQPTVANWNGQITNGLTFRAWDQFNPSTPGTPVANGTYADLSAITNYGQNAANNTTGSAYSILTDTLPLTIDAVNDAPIANTTAVALVTPGSSVTTLFGSSFSDTADQQQTVGNPTGSTANTLAGIAITADAANATTEGSWQYSVNGGTSYITIVPGSVSETGALVLPNTALIKFVGVPGYSGTPGNLTVRLIDSSTQVVVPGGTPVTGAGLQGGSTAYTGVDVSTGSNDNGGTTAVSAAEVPLGTIVGSLTTSTTYTEPNDTSAVGNEVFVNSAVVLNSGTYTTATLSVTGHFQAGEDVLAFTANAGTMGNITGSYNAGTGVLTLTSAGHTATAAQWQTALASVQYYDSSDTPSTTNTRTVTSSITDSSANVFSLGTTTITVVSVDDSPILNTAVAVSLPHGTEDAVGAPVGASAGFLVSSLAGTSLNVTDPDGSSTGAATTGIAITHADTSEGNWWYSTNNGTTWTQMTAITGSNVLQLVANANTRLYFQPTVADWNGQIANGLTFRAWDQFNPSTPGTPVANGTYADLSAITNYGQNAANNTTGSAYSILTDTLPLTIDAVNDAPIATGSATLPAVTVGDPPASGTVSGLFTPSFNDQKDQQFSATNTTGSTANTLAGIAIVADAATSSQGAWKYSLDGGTTWVNIPTVGLSNTTALILPNTARIEFVGTPGYVGTPGALTVRLIDSSNGAVAFSASTDVSTNGGITAISANTVPLNTVVNAVPVVTTQLNPPIAPSDILTQQRDALLGNAGILGSRIFTGGLNTDWLLGENVFRVMEVGIPGVANVSADVFYGTVPKQTLTFEAVNLSGGALPPWLLFDVSTLRFTGTPPEGSEGTIDARVIARDFKGREAVADVHIVVVREQNEVRGLMALANDRQAITIVPAPTPTQAPATPTPIIIDNPVANTPPPGNNATPPTGGEGAPRTGGEAPAAPAPGTGSVPAGSGTEGRQGFGLTPQLREFSQAGRMARARGLLNALSAGPAAL